MHRKTPTILIATLLSAAVSVAAAPPAVRASESATRRIILHGVDCTIETATVCGTDRVVFDEALETVGADAHIILRTDLAGDLVAGTQLAPAAADAVRDYVIAAGAGQQQLAVNAAAVIHGAPRTELQLTRAEQ